MGRLICRDGDAGMLLGEKQLLLLGKLMNCRGPTAEGARRRLPRPLVTRTLLGSPP